MKELQISSSKQDQIRDHLDKEIEEMEKIQRKSFLEQMLVLR